MIRILKHQTHLPSQPSHASPARVLLVDQDPTTTRLQQTVQMLGKSSLPGTVLPHDGNKFSGFDFDADSRQGFSLPDGYSKETSSTSIKYSTSLPTFPRPPRRP